MPLLAFTLRELWSRAHGRCRRRRPGDPPGRLPVAGRCRGRAEPAGKRRAPPRRRAGGAAGRGAPRRRCARPSSARWCASTTRASTAAAPRPGTSWTRRCTRTLEAFVEARLLVSRSDEAGRRSVEVAHEALLRKWPLLRDWLDDERGFLIGRLQLQRALDDWQAAAPAQRDSALLQGLMLERARVWLADKPKALSAAQRDFIAASVARATALRRAARRRWIGHRHGAACWRWPSSPAWACTCGRSRWPRRRWPSRSRPTAGCSAPPPRWPTGRPTARWRRRRRPTSCLPGAKTRSAVWQAGVALPPPWRFSVPAVDARGELPAGDASARCRRWPGARDGGAAGRRPRRRAAPAAARRRERAHGAVPAERQLPPSKDRPEAVLALQPLADGARLAVLEDGRVLRQAAGAERYALVGAGATPLARRGHRRRRRRAGADAGRAAAALAGLRRRALRRAPSR